MPVVVSIHTCQCNPVLEACRISGNESFQVLLLISLSLSRPRTPCDDLREHLAHDLHRVRGLAPLQRRSLDTAPVAWRRLRHRLRLRRVVDRHLRIRRALRPSLREAGRGGRGGPATRTHARRRKEHTRQYRTLIVHNPPRCCLLRLLLCLAQLLGLLPRCVLHILECDRVLGRVEGAAVRVLVACALRLSGQTAGRRTVAEDLLLNRLYLRCAICVCKGTSATYVM